MARKKTTSAASGAERMRLYRERRADSGYRDVAVSLPGSLVRSLDAEAERRGLTRAALYEERLAATGNAPPPAAPAPSPGSPVDKRLRRVCNAILRLRDKTRWRLAADGRHKGTVTKESIERIASDLRLSLPTGSEWDELVERL